jgi:hypothetical protein
VELQATMPTVVLDSGCQIVLVAISPTTGAPVSGVTVDRIAIYGDDVSDDAGSSSTAAVPVEPLFVPLPIDGP